MNNITVEAFFSILTLITFLSFVRISLCFSKNAKNTFDIKKNINRLEAAIQLNFPSVIDTLNFSYNKQILGEKTREKAPQLMFCGQEKKIFLFKFVFHGKQWNVISSLIILSNILKIQKCC